MAKQRLHSVRDHTRDALRDFKSLFRHSASKQEADDAIATLRNSLDEWKNEKIDIAIFSHNKDHLQTLRSLMINADDGDVFENLKKVKSRGMSPIKTFKRQSHDKKTVNEKTETTVQPELQDTEGNGLCFSSYKYPENPKVTLWEVHAPEVMTSIERERDFQPFLLSQPIQLAVLLLESNSIATDDWSMSIRGSLPQNTQVLQVKVLVSEKEENVLQENVEIPQSEESMLRLIEKSEPGLNKMNELNININFVESTKLELTSKDADCNLNSIETDPNSQKDENDASSNERGEPMKEVRNNDSGLKKDEFVCVEEFKSTPDECLSQNVPDVWPADQISADEKPETLSTSPKKLSADNITSNQRNSMIVQDTRGNKQESTSKHLVSTPDHQLSTLDCLAPTSEQPVSTPDPQPSTLNHQLSTSEHLVSTPDHQLATSEHLVSTLDHQQSTSDQKISDAEKHQCLTDDSQLPASIEADGFEKLDLALKQNEIGIETSYISAECTTRNNWDSLSDDPVEGVEEEENQDEPNSIIDETPLYKPVEGVENTENGSPKDDRNLASPSLSVEDKDESPIKDSDACEKGAGSTEANNEKAVTTDVLVCGLQDKVDSDLEKGDCNLKESPKTETNDGRTFKASTEDDIEDDVEHNISSTGGTQTETANTDTPKMIIFDMDETISKIGRVEKSLQLQKVDAFFSGIGRKLKGNLKGRKTKVKEFANKIPVGRACEKKPTGDFEMDNVEIHDLSLATFYASSVQDVLMGIAVKLEKKKSEAFLCTITGSYHEGILELKTAWMMKRSRTIAALSAAGGAVPVPGVSAVLDVALLLKEFTFFRKQFGLDEVALKRLRRTSGVNQEALEELLKDCACLALDKKTLVELGKRFAVQTAVEEVSRLIPVIGSIVAGGISFYTSLKILNLLINDMKEASLKIGILLECINSEK